MFNGGIGGINFTLRLFSTQRKCLRLAGTHLPRTTEHYSSKIITYVLQHSPSRFMVNVFNSDSCRDSGLDKC